MVYLKNNETEGCGCNWNEDSCIFPRIKIDGKVYLRDTKNYDANERCHDCQIINKKGNIHHLKCDMEECPRCKRQLISCKCDLEELINDEKSMKIKYLQDEMEDFYFA